VLKDREKHTQARNSESKDGVCGNVDTATPRITAQTLINEPIGALYPCHSNVQLYRPTSVIEMAAKKIDVISIIDCSTESILKMLLHLGYLSEHGIYQRVLNN
jgi:hypothetical protein